MKKQLISIIGATSAGKTQLAIKLANKYETEVISCDSRQFYKELKIGAGIPTKLEKQGIKHHFIAHKSILDNYNIFDFEKEALQKIKELFKIYNYIILVGGSGLYEKIITEGLNEIVQIPMKIRTKIIQNYQMFGIKFLQIELYKKDIECFNKIDTSNPYRLIRALEVIEYTGKSILYFQNQPKKQRYFKIKKIGIQETREFLYRKINQRVNLMIKNGLIQEAKNLLPYRHYNALKTIGYNELFKYFDGKLSLESSIEEIKKNSRRYAKRQMTWFKKDKNIKWINSLTNEDILI